MKVRIPTPLRKLTNNADRVEIRITDGSLGDATATAPTYEDVRRRSQFELVRRNVAVEPLQDFALVVGPRHLRREGHCSEPGVGDNQRRRNPLDQGLMPANGPLQIVCDGEKSHRVLS